MRRSLFLWCDARHLFDATQVCFTYSRRTIRLRYLNGIAWHGRKINDSLEVHFMMRSDYMVYEHEDEDGYAFSNDFCRASMFLSCIAAAWYEPYICVAKEGGSAGLRGHIHNHLAFPDVRIDCLVLMPRTKMQRCKDAVQYRIV